MTPAVLTIFATAVVLITDRLAGSAMHQADAVFDRGEGYSRNSQAHQLSDRIHYGDIAR